VSRVHHLQQALVAVLFTARIQGLNLDFLCNQSMGILAGKNVFDHSDDLMIDETITEIEHAKRIAAELVSHTNLA